MSFLDQIRLARQAHDELRASPPVRGSLAEKADRYRGVKAVLDVLWESADHLEAKASIPEVRRAVRRLTVDAEYYAGLNDAEGFRDPADVRAAYDLLERAFAVVG